MQASDFKKIGAKGYKAWRILSSSGTWGEVYQARERVLRKYRTGVIFPEQLLGLSQKAVFAVSVARDGDKITSSITAVRNFVLWGAGEVALDSLEAILHFESENSGVDKIKLGGTMNADKAFYNRMFFTSVKDALAYQADQQTQLLSQIA